MLSHQTRGTTTITPAHISVFDTSHLAPNHVSFSDQHQTTSKVLVDFTTRIAWCNMRVEPADRLHCPNALPCKNPFIQQTDNYACSVLSESNFRREEKKDTSLEIAIAMLREYYEGPPVFYASEIKKPKVFKPVLLYHSNSEHTESNNDLNVKLGNDTRHERSHKTSPEIQQSSLKETQRDYEMIIGGQKRSHSRGSLKELLESPSSSESANEPSEAGNHISFPCHSDSEIGTGLQGISNQPWSRSNQTGSSHCRHDSLSSSPTCTSSCTNSAFQRPHKSFRPYKTTKKDNNSSTLWNFPSISALENIWHFGLGPNKSHLFQNDLYKYTSFMSDLSTSSAEMEINSRVPPCLNWAEYDSLVKRNCLGQSNTEHVSNDCSGVPFPEENSSFQFSPGLGKERDWELQTDNRLDQSLNEIPPTRHVPVVKAEAESNTRHFRCHVCDVVCSTAIRLKAHLRVHSAEKPHKCECGRGFARKEELTRHRRIHSDHKPFPCHMCGKAFGRKDHLNKHCTTHLQTSEKKVHTCEVVGCWQRYTRSDALARHQLSAHGIKAKPSKWRPQRS